MARVWPLCSAIAGPTNSMSVNGGSGTMPAKAASATSTGVPASTIPEMSLMNRPSTRLTMNDGASAASTHVLRSALPSANAVAVVASSVASPRITSTSGITCTGLKKCTPTTRSGCARSAAISVIDSDEVLVASTHVSEMRGSISAKTAFFASITSTIASITRSAPAKAALSTLPVTRATRRFRSSGPTRPLRASMSICSCTYATPLSTRAWSMSLSTTGTLRRCTSSNAICPAISPAPAMPTLVILRASDLSGAPEGRLARRCTRSKA